MIKPCLLGFASRGSVWRWPAPRILDQLWAWRFQFEWRARIPS